MPDLAQARRVLQFGPFEVDLRSEELKKSGERVKLQGQPFQALAMLLERPGEIVTREELRQRLWPTDAFGDFEHGLNTAIKKLREALEDSADTPKYVETLPRRGYRFIPPVNDATALLASPWWHRRRAWVSIALALSVAGLSAAYTQTRRDRLTPIRAVAVLPFENLTGDAKNAYLADGLTAVLTTKLAQTSGLRVISATSASQYGSGSKKKVPEIARELQVDGVVEGDVRRAGKTLWVDVQLIHAPTDRHVWAESYEVRNLSLVETQAARDLIKEVRVQLTPNEQSRLARQEPTDSEAYQAYLMGRALFDQGGPEKRLRARDYFEDALRRDPEFAPAYAALAELYVRDGPPLLRPDERTGSRPAWNARVKARQFAVMALEQNEALAEAHMALGWADLLDWDWSSAERELRRAIELNPNYALAHTWYANYLLAVYRDEEALAHVERALQLDPASGTVNTNAGVIYQAAGRTDRAKECFQRALEVDPSKTHVTMCLVRMHILEGKYEEAIALGEKTYSSGERIGAVLGILAYAYGRAGRRDKALALLQEFGQQEGGNYMKAYAHIGIGDFDGAFEQLEKVYERRGYLHTINREPLMQPLRSDPRFDDLLRRIGLPTEKPATVAAARPRDAKSESAR